MPGFDFPNAPSNGQIAIGPGGISYVWDNTKWASTAAAGTPFAPLASPVFTGDPQAPTPASTDSDTSIATTAFVQAVAAPFGNNTGRNLVHNGRFDVAQRGVGPFTANGVYTADRWQTNIVTDTASFSAVYPGVQAGLDENAAFVFRNVFTGNAGAGAYNQIAQKIESVGRLSGRTVTLSFTATASAAGVKLGANLYQYFGTGGSPSAGGYIQATGASFTLTTGWVRYSATFTVPSISGKTLGTNGDDFTQLVLGYSSGATNNAVFGNIGVQSGTVYIWGVQLELGSTATPFAKRDPADELQLCQRFYSTFIITLICPVVTNLSGYVANITYPTSMRATPTVAGAHAGGNATRGITFGYQTTVGTNAWFGGSPTAGDYETFTVTASADL